MSEQGVDVRPEPAQHTVTTEINEDQAPAEVAQGAEQQQGGDNQRGADEVAAGQMEPGQSEGEGDASQE